MADGRHLVVIGTVSK